MITTHCAPRDNPAIKIYAPDSPYLQTSPQMYLESKRFMRFFLTYAASVCVTTCLALPAFAAPAQKTPTQKTPMPAGTAASASSLGTTPLDRGFYDMYNLDFPQAHQQFATWMAAHPDDPMGPVCDAAAYLFTEFHRLGVLDVQLFAEDNNFENRNKNVPDPAIKVAFDQRLDQANHLADAVLAKSPQDTRALFVKTLANGLHGDYAQMIEKRDFAGLQYTKAASQYADQLLKIDPQHYDAYLAIGLENYILGLKPAPVRWLLNLAGAQTNSVVGKQDMQLAATKGHYLAPFARLLLAVAALRDHDKTKAKELLSSLATEFPNNPLYARQLAKIQ